MEAALGGLGGVCELLYRRYAPPSSAATALRLHHCALRLLRHLTHAPHHMQHAHHEYAPYYLFFYSTRNTHTYIPLTLYPRRGSRGISDIPPRHPRLTKFS
jgi:hypothetical protein